MSSAPDDPDRALRRRLLERVRHSVVRHREYTTVRRDAAAGLQELWRGPSMRVARIVLPAGVPLPWGEGALAREILVLDGGLVGAAGAGLRLDRHDHFVQVDAPAGGLRAGARGAEVWLRERHAGLDGLPELEARWWRLAQARPGPVRSSVRRWAAASPGVDVLPLAGDREVVSMLVRFAPGASVPDHHHALDEDCVVLDGEMFLGDILLRPGDYQFAPAGGGHWGETSDVGVLFFFHGALDPVLTQGPTRGSAAASRFPSGSAA